MAEGLTPDASMFADLFRIISDHGLAIPPEIAAVFRSLATVEGTVSVAWPLETNPLVVSLRCPSWADEGRIITNGQTQAHT